MNEKQDVYTRVTNKIIADLERGNLTWLQPWQSGHAAGEISKPLRAIGKPYQGINVIMLWASAMEQGFDCPIWLTYKQAAELGGQVRKGEKGSLVVYADKITRTETNDKGEDVETAIPFMKGYKEFLKIDFPLIPYQDDAKTFWQLVALGREIRLLHLLESPKLSQFITRYPVGGDNAVQKIEYDDGKVYINKDQYFEGVPEVAWNFYIGGYQPAQKWLKDRKGRNLTFDDITHYQKIIIALAETDRLMKEIDAV